MNWQESRSARSHKRCPVIDLGCLAAQGLEVEATRLEGDAKWSQGGVDQDASAAVTRASRSAGRANLLVGLRYE